MNTLFTTSASLVRRMVLPILLALCLVPLMLRGTAHAAQASTACTSRITHLTAITIYNHQPAYISGQCLGTQGGYSGKDSYFFYIHVFNGTQSWNACYVGDTVTCSISIWGQNEIEFNGFAGQYGQGSYMLYQGEPLAVDELNPQTQGKWSKCTVYVGYASNCLTQLGTTYQGTGHNITVNLTSNLALTSIQENLQENISGYARWTAPLYGSGPFTGQMYDDGVVIFTSIASDGSGTKITFTGKVNPNGSINGNYTVNNGYQIGTWQVSPA